MLLKKTLDPEIKKQIAVEIVEEYELSIARACKLMEIHSSYYYYQEKRDDTEVEEAICGDFGAKAPRKPMIISE